MGSNTGEPARDVITNTLYFKHNLGISLSADFDNIATDLANLFNGATDFFRGCNQIETRLYSMEDAEPRPIRGKKVVARSYIASGAREVALCLSFRGERNLKRERGRIYLGPTSGQANPRPGSTLLDAAIAVANGLAGIGGVDVDWCVYSPTTYQATADYSEAFKPVQASWCDDEWDVQRSRGLRATTRKTATHNE